MDRDTGNQAEYIEDMLSGDSLGDSAPPARVNEVIKKFNLSDRFTILTDRPIRDLGGLFSKAFEIRDIKQKEDLYAIMLPNSLPIRFSGVQKAKQFYNSSFANVIDAGFTDAARGEFGNYAIITEKPRGTKLSLIIEDLKKASENKQQKYPLLGEDFIANEIVAPINEVLRQFAENEICHGRINHDNVYISGLEEPKLLLGECFSEPCGYQQYHQYEQIHRAQSMPLGKGSSTIESDYFALGVLVFYCIFGEMPGRNTNLDEFITQRLVKGSYNTYLGMAELTPRLTDLLRGLLVDSDLDRWNYEQVYNWWRGKKFNLLRPKVRKEAVRSYDFQGVQHVNKRHLAHTYYLNWDEAAKDIRDRKLIKWLELSVNDKETADNLASLVASAGGEKSKSRADDDELISKALILLDPEAPIRFRNISVNIDGFGPMLANAWLHQNQSEIQTFSDVIRLNILDYKAVREATPQKLDRWVLQRLQNYMKIKTIGFGIERCLYDLNPTLPCQSPMLAQQFIIDINQLLFYLNDNANKLLSSEPVDRHIAAFLASKLEMAQEIKLKIMRNLKDERSRNQLVRLALLAFAQRKATVGRLSGLGGWIASKIKVVVDSLHSRKLRKEMNEEIKNLADQGNLEAILQLVCNSDYFHRDIEGFSDAQRNYAIYDGELRMIRARQALSMQQNSSYLYGLYLSKIIGVLTFLTVLVMATV